MKFLQRIRRPSKVDPADLLYHELVRQSRSPEFYAVCGVPDTLDGRFDLLVLHVVLVLRRLKSEGDAGRLLSQALFDIMAADFDRALRELGVGDTGVGKRIKAMIAAFYGRLSAYDAALAEEGTALRAALRRNLYGTVASEADAVGLDAIADYCRREAAGLARQDGAALLGGSVRFGLPPADSSRASA